MHEADSTVTTAELEYEVVDLEGLLAMVTKTRKDKHKSRKGKDVGEDCRYVCGFGSGDGEAEAAGDEDQPPLCVVWNFFAL
ncbi:hypothetical protein FIBSPDRAFT_250395 [Athelia psychrophila]|uniref:Uncharacterized protein n=1 Tax=Athelia psychrophila TaxID=1759441 RepID=A0A165XXD0_9AGAM|nr:hypothetical protein FIBSPDRAFT_250395 [Fibularhizoctonia sp. CBS 109695]